MEEYRFATLEPLQLSECKICFGIAKTKCMFCGQKCPKIESLNEKQRIQLQAWKDKIAYLKRTKEQLIALNSLSTGCEEVDREIKVILGDWVQYIKGRPCLKPFLKRFEST